MLAPISCPGCELIAGTAPIGRLLSTGMMPTGLLGVAGAGWEAAAVTLTVAVAAGGVQAALVAMLAVAVSFTEVTEEAPNATGTCAAKDTVLVSVTERTVHFAVPSPVLQPLVNVGSRLDGSVPRARDTPEAGPFSVDTCTVKDALWPRWILAWERWTVTQSSV